MLTARRPPHSCCLCAYVSIRQHTSAHRFLRQYSYSACDVSDAPHTHTHTPHIVSGSTESVLLGWKRCRCSDERERSKRGRWGGTSTCSSTYFFYNQKKNYKKMRARDKCKWKKSANFLLFGRFTIIHGISDICEHTEPTNTHKPASICTFVEQKS